MHCYNPSFTCILQDEVLGKSVLEKMSTLTLSGLWDKDVYLASK